MWCGGNVRPMWKFLRRLARSCIDLRKRPMGKRHLMWLKSASGPLPIDVFPQIHLFILKPLKLSPTLPWPLPSLWRGRYRLTCSCRLVADPPAAVAPSHKKKPPIQPASNPTNAAATNVNTNSNLNSNANTNINVAASAGTSSATDVISITIPTFPEKSISLGPVRHRFCEPLLRSEDGSETLWEGIGRAVQGPSLSMAERVSVWEGVGMVGDMARIGCECHPLALGPRFTAPHSSSFCNRDLALLPVIYALHSAIDLIQFISRTQLDFPPGR